MQASGRNAGLRTNEPEIKKGTHQLGALHIMVYTFMLDVIILVLWLIGWLLAIVLYFYAMSKK